MRFLANGPAIPHELLELRDSGQVVFFCGAGVSIPAGFPSFLKLTELVIRDLDISLDAPGRRLLAKIQQALAENEYDAAPAIDQLMGALQRDYGTLQIEGMVAKHLRTKKGAPLRNHQTVIQLATDQRGITRLVTTNFDTMFEAARPSVRWSVPPIFPSLNEEDPLNGLVYLHGRLEQRRARQLEKVRGLILGSADFGRAYLADGRTLRFVNELFRNYVVVFLGYAADDPPMRYLLEGLRSLGGGVTRPRYAFVDSASQAMTQRWIDRGVEPIGYLKQDTKHSGLWHSLEAWATRARNPTRWRTKVLHRAKDGPSNLEPHERGQVVSIVRTVEGARSFAETPPPVIPAAWLCVFDPVIRYAKPAADFGIGEPSEQFDPLAVFGLDDDPVRPLDINRTIPDGAIDILSTLQEDDEGQKLTRLAGDIGSGPWALQPRLFHLGRWIEKIAGDPITAWWAAKYTKLHPSLASWIESTPISIASTNSPVHRFWQLYLEEGRRVEDRYSVDLHQLFKKAKATGWSGVRHREFRKLILPTISFTSPWRTPKPPMKSADEVNSSQIARINLWFPHLPAERPIPKSALALVIRSMGIALEHGASLLADADERWHRLPSLFPVGKSRDSYSDEDSLFLWFKELFSRLTRIDVAAANQELMCWPKGQRFYFLKLRLWAYSSRRLIAAQIVAEEVLDLQAELFWDHEVRRELLFAIRNGWTDFSKAQRSAIELKILRGPPRRLREKREKHAIRTASTAASILGWLVQHKCELTHRSMLALPRLRKIDPKWHTSWERHAADSFESSGGLVRSETDPANLESIPLSEVVDVATSTTKHDFKKSIEYDPFRGLVGKRPLRALSALRFQTRRNSYPVAFWRDLLSYWPETASPRMTCVLGLRLATLPDGVFLELLQPVSWWLREHLHQIFQYRKDLAWKTWDRVLGELRVSGAAATKSNISESGSAASPSRRTLNHALSGIVGDMARGLLKILGKIHLERGEGLPLEVSKRMEGCLSAPGEGKDHAISVLCSSLQWLHDLDPVWTKKHLLPLFQLNSDFVEPAWSGYAHHNQIARPDLFNHLKPSLLNVIAHAPALDWKSGTLEKMVQHLVVATVFFSRKHQLVRYPEARACLRATGALGRAAAMRFVRHEVRNAKAWTKFGRVFVARVWPKEMAARSEETSRLLAVMVADAGSHAAAATKAALPLIGPGDHLDSFIHHVNQSRELNGKALAVSHPMQTLELLDRLMGVSPSRVPYGLEKILETLIQSDRRVSETTAYQRLRSLLDAR